MIATDTAEQAAAALAEELQSLVRTAARRPDLVLREGPPGCAWSFSFDRGLVTVDPDSLRTLAPDLCRGLTLHEAMHAAVTVLHDVMPNAMFRRFHPLLNCLEDIRIEIWMRARFPGAVGWIRAYNDVFYGLIRQQPLPQSRQVQFLRGILEQWWVGSLSPGTLPEVETALEGCREAISAATACQPPLEDDREQIVASQRAMWRIVEREILPTWQRLVKADRAEGIGSVAEQELREFGESTGGGTGRDSRRLREGPQGGSTAGADAAALRQSITDSLGADAYLAAWQRVGPLADRLGDELMRLIMPKRRLRWQAGQSTGPRLDLRRAMQFEADPRLHDTLWSKPVVPSRREPAIVLLLDRSGSMSGNVMGRAFDGLVLFVEVCRRIGVPAAVWSFADQPQEELDWDAPLDATNRRRLARLPHSCHGHTDLAAALVAVHRRFEGHHGDPKLLFVLSDGEPDRPADTLAAARRLKPAGIDAFGLGLGPDTAGLGRYFPANVTGIPAAEIPGAVARLLENSVDG